MFIFRVHSQYKQKGFFVEVLTRMSQYWRSKLDNNVHSRPPKWNYGVLYDIRSGRRYQFHGYLETRRLLFTSQVVALTSVSGGAKGQLPFPSRPRCGKVSTDREPSKCVFIRGDPTTYSPLSLLRSVIWWQNEPKFMARMCLAGGR